MISDRQRGDGQSPVKIICLWMDWRSGSFEAWYQSQSHYKKLEDTAPQELLDATLSVSDVARLLGIHRNSVYNMVNKRHLFTTVKANDKIRIYKDSFESWYKSQNRHTIITG